MHKPTKAPVQTFLRWYISEVGVDVPYIDSTKMYCESTKPNIGSESEAKTLAQNPAAASHVGL